MSDKLSPTTLIAASLYPLEARAIPNGDDWLIIFSGAPHITDIDPTTRDILIAHAIARAQAEFTERQFPIVGASFAGDRPIYGFTKEQKEEIREIVTDAIRQMFGPRKMSEAEAERELLKFKADFDRAVDRSEEGSADHA